MDVLTKKELYKEIHPMKGPTRRQKATNMKSDLDCIAKDRIRGHKQ